MNNTTPYIPDEVKNAASVASKRGYFDADNEDINEWRDTFIGRFLSRWPGQCVTLDVFKAVLGHKPTWADITDRNLRDLRDALLVGRCPSSVKTMCAQLKSVLNANAFNVHLDKDPMELCDTSNALSVKRNPSQAVYLTQQELERLDKVHTISPVERYVKRIFMIEALTGARHIDAERISPQHINNENGTLVYRAEKTGKPVTVPAHKMLPKYLDDTGCTKVNRLTTFNDTLRSLCFRAGIRENITLARRGEEQQGPKWSFVSSHTGRRTFATLLYLHGVNVDTIAQLMGHSNPMTTLKNYICDQRGLDEKTLAFFK